jgi:hypothetical protein
LATTTAKASERVVANPLAWFSGDRYDVGGVVLFAFIDAKALRVLSTLVSLFKWSSFTKIMGL